MRGTGMEIKLLQQNSTNELVRLKCNKLTFYIFKFVHVKIMCHKSFEFLIEFAYLKLEIYFIYLNLFK